MLPQAGEVKKEPLCILLEAIAMLQTVLLATLKRPL
jgi:hypothetical protein